MSGGSDCGQDGLRVAAPFPAVDVGIFGTDPTLCTSILILGGHRLDMLVLELLQNLFLKFLHRNPSVSALFADLVIFSTCCFQFRSFVIVTPRGSRYLA